MGVAALLLAATGDGKKISSNVWRSFFAKIFK